MRSAPLWQMMELGNMMLLSDFLQGKMMRHESDLGYTLKERGPAQNHPIRQTHDGAGWESEKRSVERQAAWMFGAAYNNAKRDEWEMIHLFVENADETDYYEKMKEWNSQARQSEDNWSYQRDNKKRKT